MSYIGRKLRKRRLQYADHSYGIMVPIDHGLTLGPITGIKSLSHLSRWLYDPNISAIVTHKGLLEHLAIHNLLHPSTAIIMHINGMTHLSATANTKEPLTHIVAALRLGADAISVQINFTEDNYAHNLTLLGQVVDEAHQYGLPVLAMVYDKQSGSIEQQQIRMQNFIRIAIELGCDAIKISFPNNINNINESILWHKEVIDIYFAGGEVSSESLLIAKAKYAIQAGAAGLCIGRNIFQNEQPRQLLQTLRNTIEHSLADNKIANKIE